MRWGFLTQQSHEKFLLTSAIASIFLGCSQIKTSDNRQTINPYIGDISFVTKFGFLPDKNTGEDLRIRTHLEYVENLLRHKDVSMLAQEFQQKRKHTLDLLHEYRIAGIFPRNYDYKTEGRPCFIDKDNRICAVGFLVEQTSSREIAEEINHKYKYATIYEMTDALVNNWISSSGLTKEECAMIQPNYGPPPVYTVNYISPAYGVSSSIVSAANISLNVINGIQISKGARDNTVGVVGILTGAGQVVLGVLNIGLGTTTMMLSTWNLVANKKSKPKLLTWNLYAIPTSTNDWGAGLRFSKKF